MLETVKESYQTGRGKAYEWSLERPWHLPGPTLLWDCWIVATPLLQGLSQDQNVRIRVRLPFLLLAQLDKEIEEIPEEFIRRSVQLILEKQSVPSGEVKLCFTEEGLRLEALGKTEVNKLWVSWSEGTNFSVAMIVARLEEALSDARAQQRRIGFHQT